MHYLSILFTLLIISVLPPSARAQSLVRSELSRYTLLGDRVLVDRDLKREPYAQFFELDIYASSGIKSLRGDTASGIDSDDPTTSVSNVLDLVNRNINSERYVDIDVALSSPLPYLKIKKFRLLPNIFIRQNLAAMLTLSNKASTVNPRVQLYLKTDRKIGLNTRLRWKKDEEWRLALYKLQRVDLLGEKDSQTIADEGKLFAFQGLDSTSDSYSLDLAYIKDKEKYRLLIEAQELKLISSSDVTSNYGNRAFFHSRFTLKKEGHSSVDWYPFIGLHQRKKYTLYDGLYVGTKIQTKFEIPLEVVGKISNQFFTFIPQIKFKWFEFNYALKLAYRNPQDDIWVPTIHSINIRVPFP